MYLLDTNAIINFLGATFTPEVMKELGRIIDAQSNVSIITKMEALGYNFKSKSSQNITEAFFDGSTILAINEEVVNTTISIRRSKKIDLPDAIIAATALTYNLILITSNVADFKNIQGLRVSLPQNL